MYDECMERATKATTFCLTHQLPEEQTSPIGLVCPQCKHRLYTRPPQGRCRNFWESQPAAYGLDGVQSLIELLQTELGNDMTMLGTVTPGAVTRDHVKIHRR